MKQIEKSRESAHSNLRAHIPTFTILQKKEPCDTWDTKQFRSSVGGCTAAAATWRHPENLQDSCVIAINALQWCKHETKKIEQTAPNQTVQCACVRDVSCEGSIQIGTYLPSPRPALVLSPVSLCSIFACLHCWNLARWSHFQLVVMSMLKDHWKSSKPDFNTVCCKQMCGSDSEGWAGHLQIKMLVVQSLATLVCMPKYPWRRSCTLSCF